MTQEYQVTANIGGAKTFARENGQATIHQEKAYKTTNRAEAAVLAKLMNAKLLWRRTKVEWKVTPVTHKEKTT